MTAPEAPPWGGDPTIAWRILLAARPARALDPGTLSERQRVLHDQQRWPAPSPVREGSLDAVRRELGEIRDEPLVLGRADGVLLVSAFHAYLDGLGLLEVLARLAGGAVTSEARGVGERARATGGTTARLREVATTPPALLALPRCPDRTPGDSYARVSVPTVLRTAEIVHAAAAAVVAHNDAAGRRTRHLTVAVGAGRPSAPGEPLANRSELLRLRDLEGCSVDEVRRRLREAPLDAAGGSGGGGGATVALAMRALAPRLGSTLLVSHLGTVETDVADDLAFYPVTAGGTGLSLGAVSHGGSTVLTLRGRASRWDPSALDGLLQRVADAVS